jgi:hypothetical protein
VGWGRLRRPGGAGRVGPGTGRGRRKRPLPSSTPPPPLLNFPNQNRSCLVILSAAKDLGTRPVRPFAALRVTRHDRWWVVKFISIQKPTSERPLYYPIRLSNIIRLSPVLFDVLNRLSGGKFALSIAFAYVKIAMLQICGFRCG